MGMACTYRVGCCGCDFDATARYVYPTRLGAADASPSDADTFASCAALVEGVFVRGHTSVVNNVDGEDFCGLQTAENSGGGELSDQYARALACVCLGCTLADEVSGRNRRLNSFRNQNPNRCLVGRRTQRMDDDQLGLQERDTTFSPLPVHPL